jgi:hypothetical protein
MIHVLRRNGDGRWELAQPMGFHGDGVDVELSRDDRWWRWELYDRYRLVAAHSHRWRLTAAWVGAVAQTVWRHRIGAPRARP